MKKGKSKKPKKKRSQIKVSIKGQSPSKKNRSGIAEVSLDELKAIIARAEGLSSEDLSKLDAAVDTLAVLTRELEAKGASVKRMCNTVD